MLQKKNNYKFTDGLKIIPLGGLEEIGNNSMVLELNDEMIMIDCGLGFPDEYMYGIDITLPDLSYIFANKNKLKAIFFTHGHFDHIGAIPYFYEKMGNPLIFAPPLTAELIKSICAEKNIVPNIQIIDIKNDVIKLNNFVVIPVQLQHSIPDTIAFFIKTIHGNIFLATDFKIDDTPTDGIYTDFDKINQLKNQDKGIDLAMIESTSVEIPGHSLSEMVVLNNLQKIFSEAKGRIIIAMFASHLSRVQHVIDSAEKLRKKVFISGRTLEKNIDIFLKLNRLRVSYNVLDHLSNISKYDPKDCIILVTGAQGEEYSAAYRLAENTHKDIKIQSGDTVIFSASEIPGNEAAISRIQDKLVEKGAKLIYEKYYGVHASGHGQQEDLLYMLKILSPKFFIPIHGALHMRASFRELVSIKNLLPRENIFLPLNGQVCILKDKKLYLTKEKLSNKAVLVDGYGIGDVGKKILSERQMMAEGGILVVILTISLSTKQVNVDFLSKGLVFQHSIKGFINELKNAAIKSGLSYFETLDKENVKYQVIKRLSKLFEKRMDRYPMIVPYLIFHTQNDVYLNELDLLKRDIIF